MATPAAKGRPARTQPGKKLITSTPANVAAATITAEDKAAPRLWPLANITEATVKPSGSLCKRMAMKIIQPSQEERTKPDAMATPSNKECAARPATTELLVCAERNSPSHFSSPKWKCGVMVCS